MKPAPLKKAISADATGVLHIHHIQQEDRWAVFSVGSRKCSGILPAGVYQGCMVHVHGEPSAARKGQLKVSDVRMVKPKEEKDIATLIENTLPACGPKRAEQLAAAFGAEYADSLLSPDAIQMATRCSASQAATMASAWASAKKSHAALRFFTDAGITQAYQGRVLRHFGVQSPPPNSDVKQHGSGYLAKVADVIAKIRADPYCLTQVSGIGFKKADEIALRLDPTSHNSLDRATAFVEHALTENEENDGHCYMENGTLIQRIKSEVGTGTWSVGEALDKARCTQVGDLVALRVTRFMESAAAAALVTLIRAKPLEWSTKLTEALEECKDLTVQQQEVARVIELSGISVLTGGPGTGKTHTVGRLIQAANALGLTVIQAAPTGKAAQRIKEKSGQQALTIHRLLQWRPGSAPRSSEALSQQLVIVDEASMLDLEMLYHLVLRINPATTRLLFVGDVNQLPSVGPGAVLRDLCKSQLIPKVSLDLIFRQAAGSEIAVQASRVLRGEMIEDTGKEVRLFPINMEQGFADLLPKVLTIMQHTTDCGGPSALQVLTPGHEGETGTKSLNLALAPYLNKSQAPVNSSHPFRRGDRVMQRTNNYDLPCATMQWRTTAVERANMTPIYDKGAFNGEVGTVIWCDDMEVCVDLGDRIAIYTAKQAIAFLEPAWAMTIHKSQGSEYDTVVLVLGPQHTYMLDRALVYTALTRAKKRCFIIHSPKALTSALNPRNQEQRRTMLTETVSRLYRGDNA